jgi:peptide/nickel transport system substrate-binding protein
MLKGRARLFPSIVLILAMLSCGQQAQQRVVPQTAKDTLVIAEASTPTSLDAEFPGSTAANQEAVENNTETLVKFGTKTNSNGTLSIDATKLLPNLAESYTRSADGLTWSFTLRQGVKSYFGNELTSADVKFMIDRSIALNGDCIGFDLAVSGVNTKAPITVTGKYTFNINLAHASPLLPYVSASLPTCTIPDSTEVKKHLTASDPWARSWMATHTADFAPYHVQNMVSGQETDWVANPNYWQGPPKFKQIIVKAVPDASTRTALLERGSVDIAEGLSPRQQQDVAGKPGLVVENQVGNFGLFYMFNVGVPPLNNLMFRQALAYALPTSDIIRSVYLNSPGIQVSPGYIAPGYPGALNSWPYQPRDVAKAKALLQQSGVNLSTPIQIAYSTDQSSDQETATLIKTSLAEVGVTVQLQALSSAAYYEEFYSKKAQTILVHDAAFVVDGPYVLSLYFNPDPNLGQGNYTNFNDPAATALISQGLASQDPGQRATLATQANQLIVDQAPWGFFILIGNHLPRLENVRGYIWRSSNALRYGDIYKT